MLHTMDEIFNSFNRKNVDYITFVTSLIVVIGIAFFILFNAEHTAILIENYKELIENHDILDEKFSKYKETQKLKNFKDTSLINEKEETIENLTIIIKI